VSDVLSNREIAVLFWGIVLLIYVCRTKSVRISIWNVVKAFFAKKVLFTFLLTVVFISMFCWMFSIVNLWDISMLKDSIIYSAWSVAVIIKVIDERCNTSFKQIVIEQITANAVFTAIIDFYTFSIAVELILVFVIWFIIILEFYSRKSEKDMSVNKFLKEVLKFIYMALFVICLFEIIKRPNSLFSRDFINSLMLPIVLTFLLIPYYYLLSLYAVYEQCFVILKVMSRGNVKEYIFRRNATIRKCGLNLNCIKLVETNWRPALCETNEEFINEIDAVSHNKRISYYGE